MNGTIWCIPNNCFKVNLFAVNVWSVYMSYIPISLASNKAFLDKKGADWERWGNVRWGTVGSNNTGLHVGILGGPLIRRNLKSHPLAFLSMSSIQQEKGGIITVLGRAAAVVQFAEPLTTCTKLVLLTAPYKLGMVVYLLILAPRKYRLVDQEFKVILRPT